MKLIPWIYCLFFTSWIAMAADFPPLSNPGPAETYGKNIQRTMKLLATSTKEKPNTVKILFYGQSITEQKWTDRVLDHLKKRFPYANIIAENRAIGGHAAQRLVKTAEADLYPFYPDLLIFHVYGSHNKYEDIIKRTRERTTAEILIQTDHVTGPSAFTEITNPKKLWASGKHWPAFMNHKFLPGIVKKYNTGFCDQRSVWKDYLTENKLNPRLLLKDNVHLNEHGEFLMGEIVNAHLVYNPSLKNDPQGKVYDLELNGPGDEYSTTFEGNRVVAKVDSISSPVKILIDGKKPSEFPELYQFTKGGSFPDIPRWPYLLKIQSEANLQVEDWQAELFDVSTDGKDFKFKITGSKTGFDGEGKSNEKFISKSGRIVIEPEDWNLEYCIRVTAKVQKKTVDVSKGFKFTWKVVPMFRDRLSKDDSGYLLLAQGISNSQHKITLKGDLKGIKKLTVYSPPLK